MQNAISVSFNNQSITAFMNGNVPVIAMKPICENMGIDWHSQRQRIQRHPVMGSTAVMITSVAEDGKKREMLCLPLDMLNGWLFGIDSSRVKAEIKDKVIAYQRECFKVLANHFGMSQKAQPTESPKALPNYREKLNKAVKHWVAVSQQGGLGLSYSEAWSVVHLRTGMVDGVETATTEQLIKGLDVVGQALTGEYIQREAEKIEQPKPEPVTEESRNAQMIERMIYNLVPDQVKEVFDLLVKLNKHNVDVMAMFAQRDIKSQMMSA